MQILTWAGWLLGGCALAYLAGCIATMLAWSKRRAFPAGATPPISILKPLCGMEDGLYDDLRSFCTQDYPDYQVIFGAESSSDPALSMARRLQQEFPKLDIRVVSGQKMPGTNRKVANLMQMEAHIAFEYLVIADSDIRVGPDYLRYLAGELTDPTTGVVTCMYRGRPDGSLWSKLASLHIDEWIIPSILTGLALGLTGFGFGSTMALRRTALADIGGFAALADHLADDYQLAKLLHERGLKTVLSGYLVDTGVHEPTFSSLWQHEVRWARTIRFLQPVGHAFSFITHALPMTLLAAFMVPGPWGWAMPVAAILLRFCMHAISVQTYGNRCVYCVLLLPLRDVLDFAVWLGSYSSRQVRWRGRNFSVDHDGSMQEIG